MTTVVIKHVALNELPAAWRARLPMAPDVRVTVRIEAESDDQEQTAMVENPLFGMWRDREETTDVANYARRLRPPRYDVDGTRHED